MLELSENCKPESEWLFVQVGVTGKASERVDEISKWVMGAVGRLYPIEFNYPICENHMGISGPISSDDTELVVLTVRAACKNNMVLDALKVSRELQSHPDMPNCIEYAGVSGVSYQFACISWIESYNTERTWMDGKGEGFSKHPVYYTKGDGKVYIAEHGTLEQH